MAEKDGVTEAHAVGCVVCGRSCCTIEGCEVPGHDTSCELEDDRGWVCSAECWEIAAGAEEEEEDDG